MSCKTVIDYYICRLITSFLRAFEQSGVKFKGRRSWMIQNKTCEKAIHEVVGEGNVDGWTGVQPGACIDWLCIDYG